MNCKKMNHFSAMCRSKEVHIVDEVDDHQPSEVLFLDAESIFSIAAKMERLCINNIPIPMQIDTGASVSILSKYLWGKLPNSKNV